MDEIFKFDGPGNLNLAEALKKTRVEVAEKKPVKKPKTKKWSSLQSDSSSCDEDDLRRGRRRHRKRRRAEQGSVAARLQQQAAALEESLDDSPPADNKEEGYESSEEKEKKEKEKELSSPLSPIPSPPPLLFFPPPDHKQSKTLLKADQMLQELKQPELHSSLLSESFLDHSSVLEVSGVSTPSTDEKLTLRVRCRGKIHRFTVSKADPLVLICTDLGKELGVKGEQILLSHGTATLSSTSSPATLGLSTVDIIDAIVLQEDQLANRSLDASTVSLDPAESITLKVQTSKKSVVYSLSKMDPLGKVMTAFAAALEVPVNQLQFTFDGDSVSPEQTPSDLDMEHDDIIDARLLS